MFKISKNTTLCYNLIIFVFDFHINVFYVILFAKLNLSLKHIVLIVEELMRAAHQFDCLLALPD
jgi:hypothetical protein